MEAARIFRELTNRLPAWVGGKNGETRERLEVGPAPRGGNSYTLNSTGGSDNRRFGASFRIIANTADWDQSVGRRPGKPVLRQSLRSVGEREVLPRLLLAGKDRPGGPGRDRPRPGGVGDRTPSRAYARRAARVGRHPHLVVSSAPTGAPRGRPLRTGWGRSGSPFVPRTAHFGPPGRI